MLGKPAIRACQAAALACMPPLHAHGPSTYRLSLGSETWRHISIVTSDHPCSANHHHKTDTGSATVQLALPTARTCRSAFPFATTSQFQSAWARRRVPTTCHMKKIKIKIKSKIRDADNTPAMRTRLPDHGARTCRWHSDGTCGARMHAALQIIANANSIFSPRADCEWTGVHGVPLSARTRRQCECYTPESGHFCALRLLTMMAW